MKKTNVSCRDSATGMEVLIKNCYSLNQAYFWLKKEAKNFDFDFNNLKTKTDCRKGRIFLYNENILGDIVGRVFIYDDKRNLFLGD